MVIVESICYGGDGVDVFVVVYDVKGWVVMVLVIGVGFVGLMVVEILVG